jgi:ketosteroid isomerase-like protein
MTPDNAATLRVAFENFLAGRSDFGVELLHPDVEWDATASPIPDNNAIYHGVEEVQQFWRTWLEAWETVDFEYELVPAGDRVVALIDQRMRGRSTGIEVPMGKYAHVYTFRDGKIVHWKLYPQQADALEAAGLSAAG